MDSLITAGTGMAHRLKVGLRAAFVLAAFLVAFGMGWVLLNRPADLDRQAERTAMADAADYLCRHLGADGRFEYTVQVDGTPRGTSYNVLRHAGTIYGLALYDELSPESATRQAILRAAGYLLQRYVRPVTNHLGMRAVFSLPGEEIDGLRPQIKLGGCALGLIALIKARALDAGAVDPRVLRELGNFILFMQEENGHFRSKYDEAGLFFEGFESAYYPGEAILALTLLYEVDPDAQWLEAALRGVRYLEESRRGVPIDRLPNDHWLMIATAALLPKWEAAHEPIISRQRMLDHSLAIGTMMMHEQWRTSWIPGLGGAFTPDGAVTPSATRLEGLVALYRALPQDHPRRQSLLKAIERGVGYVARSQIQQGKAKGGFPGGSGILPSRLRSAVRIDYVQHALSALVGHYRIASAERAP